MPGGGGLNLPGGLDLSSLGIGGAPAYGDQAHEDPDDEDKPKT